MLRIATKMNVYVTTSNSKVNPSVRLKLLVTIINKVVFPAQNGPSNPKC